MWIKHFFFLLVPLPRCKKKSTFSFPQFVSTKQHQHEHEKKQNWSKKKVLQALAKKQEMFLATIAAHDVLGESTHLNRVHNKSSAPTLPRNKIDRWLEKVQINSRSFLFDKKKVNRKTFSKRTLAGHSRKKKIQEHKRAWSSMWIRRQVFGFQFVRLKNQNFAFFFSYVFVCFQCSNVVKGIEKWNGSMRTKKKKKEKIV